MDELELIESLGLHMPAKSREAILTAIIHGCYDVTVDGIQIEIGDMAPADTTIAKAPEDDLKPVFGL